ncbi:MAG: hypothetical protein ABIJ09_04080 [Pseudomonadota bacterium]
MPGMDERQKALGQALVKATKMTELGDVLKGPELLFLFSKKFKQLYSEDILNLELLYQELRTTKGVELEVLQGFMLWFKDQEGSLNVGMQLPADLLIMKPDKKAALKSKISKQVEQRLALSRPEAPVQAQKAEKIVFSGSGKKSRFRPIGVAIVGILALASVFINIQQRIPPKPELIPVTEIDLAALGLPGTLNHKQEIYVLKVPRTDWDLIPRELQKTRLRALQASLVGLGLEIIVVTDAVTWRTLVVGGTNDLVFLASTGDGSTGP